ncbi:MAG: polyprenyl synthetase family protein [bacterium]|nr:polyprenyl synthetase family protein [bacterium]
MSNADLQKILSPIQAELQQVETLVMANLETDIPLLTEVGQYILKAGGKRVRPAMLLFAAGSLGEINQGCFEAANIIEYIHTATLLHDDVVDNADLRRSKQSARSIWGNEASVLVGDYLFTVSFRELAKLDRMELVHSLSRSTTLMAKGEILQLIRSNDSATEADYLEIVLHKTATLMGCAMEMGALLAGGSPEQAADYYEIGKNIGMAFQIIDDALDYRMDATDLGKDQGMDLKERKITLPLSHLLLVADEAHQEQVLDVLDEEVITDEHVRQIAGLVEQYKVVDYCLGRADDYVKLAQKDLAKMPQNRFTESIGQLAGYVVRRDR